MDVPLPVNGYAKNTEGRNYALNAKKSLLRKIEKMKDVSFLCADYRSFEPKNQVIYCDPPYTTSYRDKIDPKTFWDQCRQWSKNNRVFVSEYSAPSDRAFSIHTKTDIRNKKDKRTENVYVLYKNI